ncbi:hypothetical protein TSAR_007288 [Trichomalopsis sarcophagae]|uniref:Uncharacterized protein n=1 Tax=Trichomalopsis sarcophagae TaxID=543379 RepID=A0A232FA61_9HYME|nr:hypothetical protein TSAR_007288 [Trichomalopsis sarcophagae]
MLHRRRRRCVPGNSCAALLPLPSRRLL